MKYAIVVDSSCDMIFSDEAESDMIIKKRVPLILRIGEQEFIDNFDLDIPDFISKMQAYQGTSGSSAPSPQAWYDAFMSADEVFAITITGTLSGSYRSAIAAKNIVCESYPDKKIHIIDSKSAGPSLSLLVYKLEEYLTQGLSFDTVVEKITDYQQQTHLLFALNSMDNLIKNGRVSALSGKIAGILGIKILGQASKEGTLDLLHKCRGKDTIYTKLIREMLLKDYQGGRVVICHCLNAEKSLHIKNKLLEKFPNAQIDIMAASALCSYYAEEGGLLLAFEKGIQ